MHRHMWTFGVVLLCPVIVVAVSGFSRGPAHRSRDRDRGFGAVIPTGVDLVILRHAIEMPREGQQTFRFATFGGEAFWGDTLHLHLAVAGDLFSGVGPGVSPNTAFAVGLKVDLEALPPELVAQLQQGEIDLDDPAATLAWLQMHAVVGVTGFFHPDSALKSLGIQCALCHSTVDDAPAPGIGRRLDGWAARDLNIGAIVALAPHLQPVAEPLGGSVDALRAVLHAWGPGTFDAAVLLDGQALRPDGTPGATLIPPAFGLAGVNLHTWTGSGSVTHWNALVANLAMHGKGTFFDPRLDDAGQFPLAASAGLGHVRHDPDLITPRLAGLPLYQLASPAPEPPPGSFDPEAAVRGARLFTDKAPCAACHVPPLSTEPGWNLHTPAEIGIDAFQANRAPDRRYRTAPLKGLRAHLQGGFYHDGRLATLQKALPSFAH